MTNLFENGRMVKLAAYNEDGLKLEDIKRIEKFARVHFACHEKSYDKVVKLVNEALDQNEVEGTIMIYGNAEYSGEVPGLAKVAKCVLEAMGYKAKITVGNDQAGRKRFRDVGLHSPKHPWCEYKERYVTYNK